MNKAAEPNEFQEESLNPETEPKQSEENVSEAQDAVSDEAVNEEVASAKEDKAPVEDSEEESYKTQYLRLRADFDNFRKRTRREKEEWTQRCLENLCSDLLTVLDHFDLGIKNSEGQEFTEDTLKGFELVRSQLGAALGKYGLSTIEATKGTFDPNLHEAITHIPSPEVPEDEIVAMTRKGYQLGNRLLRPAQVVVSAGSGDPADSEDTESGEEV
jgi:molecular chaperone GrpE